MHELLDTLPTGQIIREFLNAPETWLQVGVFAVGLIVAIWLGGWLQQRLQPVTEPGVIAGVGRTAVRTWVLGIVPLTLWLWLLTVSAVLHRRGITTEILRPAMLLAGALAVIRMGVFVLRHTLNPGSRLKAWEGVLTVSIWILVALHILGWLPLVNEILDDYALTIGHVRVSLYNIVSFIFSIALMLLLALSLANAIRWRITKSAVLEDSMKTALSKLSKFILLLLAVVVAMVTAGIDLTAFAVFGGALGVGLGLGLQRIVSNFISGFILVFEGSILQGDVISIGNTFGTVRALHARHVVIRTRDGLDILVPNENLMTSDITNWSYAGDRKIRLILPLQISYSDDPEEALIRLEKLAHGHPRIQTDPPPAAFLLGFGDNGVNLELRVWIDDPEFGGEVRSEMYRRIWHDFKVAGITFPFPQRDIYIKNPDATPAPALPGDKPNNPAKSARGRKRAPEAPPRG